MDRRSMEVTLISAEGIKDVSRLGKLRPYCVAYVDPSQKQTTQVDKEGATYPAWNKTLSFMVPEASFHHPSASLTVDIYHKSSIAGSTLIGTARVPLPDILRDAISGKLTRLSYVVRRPSGRNHGSFNISVQLGELDQVQRAPATNEPVMAYPAFPETLPSNGAAAAGAAQPRFQHYPNSSTPLPQGYPATPYYAPPSYAPYYNPPPPVVQPAYRPSTSRPNRPGFGGMGMGTGLLAGALGGLILGDVIGDMAYDNPGFDGGFGGGGFDGGFDGGFGF